MADNGASSDAPTGSKRILLRPSSARLPAAAATPPVVAVADPGSSSTVSTTPKANSKQRDKVPMILQRNVPSSEPADAGGVVNVQASMENLSLAAKGTSRNQNQPPSASTTGPSISQILQAYEFPSDKSLTMIDQSLRFVADFDFMSTSQRNSMDFLVVTAIGPPRSGKSTILSYLSGDGAFGDKLSFPSGDGEEMKSTFFVSPDNIIFIEVASVLNGSAAMELGQYGSMDSATISWNLRLMRWALSVSHVVITVSESLVDPNLFRLITSAEMIHPMESAFEEGAYPELIFVCNKVPLSYIDDAGMTQEVEQMFQNVIGRPPRISPSLFLLPHTKFNYGPRENQRYRDLKSKLYEFNRYNRSPFSEEVEGKPKIGQKISLFEWHSFAARLWEEMDQPTFFAAYAKLLP